MTNNNTEKNKISKLNMILTIVFTVLSLAFVILMIVSRDFLELTFERHQNLMSWYIRPVFLIPFCYFSYKKNLAGISITIFLLLTSMFWFSVPSVVNENSKEFLQMEIDYLTGNWNIPKILMMLLIPLAFFMLGRAIWKRSIKYVIIVIALMAICKGIWSIVFGGESGLSTLGPVIVGLLVIPVTVYIGHRRLRKSDSKQG